MMPHLYPKADSYSARDIPHMEEYRIIPRKLLPNVCVHRLGELDYLSRVPLTALVYEEFPKRLVPIPDWWDTLGLVSHNYTAYLLGGQTFFCPFFPRYIIENNATSK